MKLALGATRSTITVSPSLINTREPGSAVTVSKIGSGVLVTLSRSDEPVSERSGRSSVGRWGARVSMMIGFKAGENKLRLPARSSTRVKIW